MSTHTLTVTFDEEQEDAMAVRLARYNESSVVPLTLDQFVAQIVVGQHVQEAVQTAYRAAVERLGEAAKGADYATRKTLIEQVESQLQSV